MNPRTILNSPVIKVFGSIFGEPLDEPRFIRIALFDSPDAGRCYNGLAAQLTGNDMYGTVLFLKAFEESRIDDYCENGAICSVGEWEWNGGEDLTGLQLTEAQALYDDFCKALTKDDVAERDEPEREE